MEKRAEIRVKGRVQGVFYRKSTKEEAVRLGLKGFVKNNQDGTVSITAEGESRAVNLLMDWCRSGPPAARVDAMDVTFKQPQGYVEFMIV